MLAVETGIPHTVWLDDTRALYTATRYLARRAEMLKRRR